MAKKKAITKVLSCLITKVQHSTPKSFIFTHRKSSNEKSDAKNNLNCRSSEMRYLRCVDFLWLITQRDAIPTQNLALSEHPKLFEEEGVIVIGENSSQQTLGKYDQNASQIEMGSAEAIAANLENLAGNKPEIISSKKIESFKYTYNLILLSTPNSNKMLEEVYEERRWKYYKV